ncbi:putative helicase with zinc finger [Caerostris extrusa]|uniref:Helicase with zinc finger n=1 Tax=Caerostris extrusa TaxID=172846 RepID=A0AAV4XGP0_CAEEX|nr:putative helicase with zinc finger [Caerostris extrusa]
MKVVMMSIKIYITTVSFNSDSTVETKLHDSCFMPLHSEELQFKTSMIDHICRYCSVMVSTEAELEEHCNSETHQLIIMSDEGREWKFRPPPRGVGSDQYALFHFPKLESVDLQPCVVMLMGKRNWRNGKKDSTTDK